MSKTFPLFFLIALIMTGCGVDQERFGEEAKAARGVVSGISGSAQYDPQRFASRFAPGKAPMADRMKYAMVGILANSAKIDGDQAVIEVSILNPQTSEKIADQQWTAVKIDGSWKLQDAPLP